MEVVQPRGWTRRIQGRVAREGEHGEGQENSTRPQAEALGTERTKVLVPEHYAGCACDMDAILEIARRHARRVAGLVVEAAGG